jgi:hypothetical protein
MKTNLYASWYLDVYSFKNAEVIFPGQLKQREEVHSWQRGGEMEAELPLVSCY